MTRGHRPGFFYIPHHLSLSNAFNSPRSLHCPLSPNRSFHSPRTKAPDSRFLKTDDILEVSNLGLMVPWVSAPSNYPMTDLDQGHSINSGILLCEKSLLPVHLSHSCSSNIWGLLGQCAHTGGLDRPGACAPACRSSLASDACLISPLPTRWLHHLCLHCCELWAGLTCRLPLQILTSAPSNPYYPLLLPVFPSFVSPTSGVFPSNIDLVIQWNPYSPQV